MSGLGSLAFGRWVSRRLTWCVEVEESAPSTFNLFRSKTPFQIVKHIGWIRETGPRYFSPKTTSSRIRATDVEMPPTATI